MASRISGVLEGAEKGGKATKSNGKEPTNGGERHEMVAVQPLELGRLELRCIGISPYMQARFSAKAIQAMKSKHEAGSQAKKGRQREARNFDDDYEQAKHKFADGTCGIPAAAFRCAMIDACRLVGYKMTIAKLSVFVEHDGLDVVDGLPLVRIKGEPEKNIMATRNATGVADLRARPMWRKWSCDIRVQFDTAQFSASDVINLINRAGQQVGIGEGRPGSRESAGMGFGTFLVETA